jgi:type I restriction enzyme S subunit
MGNNFNSFKLGDITEIIAGGDKPKVFSINKCENLCIPVFANAEGDNGLQGYTNIARIFKPAVTISARGSKVGFTSIRKQPFFPIVRLLTLIPKEDILDVGYLYYNLKLNRFGGSGSGQPQITIPQISNKIISLPDLFTQQKIAAVLSVLDHKIELNNKINAELEAMAKTLYDYWFVQFDFPNEEGKPYKSSGGKMVYNKILKREIPEGWEVRKLSQIANITIGQSPSGESFNVDSNGVIFFQGSTDFGWRYPDNRVYTTAPTRFAKENDILLSVRAPIGAMNLAMYDCCIGRGLAALNSKDNYNSFLIYQMNYFRRKFDYLNSVGTTFGSLSKEELQNLELVYPPENILEKFENIVAGLDAKIQLNTKQNLEISTLRDWLLPMLMNGQVKVEETYNIHEVSKYDIAAEPEPMFNASNI